MVHEECGLLVVIAIRFLVVVVVFLFFFVAPSVCDKINLKG